MNDQFIYFHLMMYDYGFTSINNSQHRKYFCEFCGNVWCFWFIYLILYLLRLIFIIFACLLVYFFIWLHVFVLINSTPTICNEEKGYRNLGLQGLWESQSRRYLYFEVRIVLSQHEHFNLLNCLSWQYNKFFIMSSNSYTLIKESLI